eukprot:TRINITY_DN8092_c4_g1_i1.p1 TRINITY_DN8092_c4_g1~~TRINITY_DN8092_c4_g1_i1.p1  ORF type:complete len:279 (+),score=66.00 TRINITY_DN8092_c4_g1_i1:62-838(+)
MADADGLYTVSVDGGVAVVTMAPTSGKFKWGTPKAEHRWNPYSVQGMHAALDRLEHDQNVRCLVVAANGKFWSNGMDLNWLDQATPAEGAECNKQLNALMARVLCFPVPTVAALSGHWCAAGGMMGLCFDYRVMSSKKGYFFIPGVDLGIVYSPFQTALMKAKLPFHMHRDVIVLNLRRWNAVDLLREHVVDEACEDVHAASLAAARRLSAKGGGPARKALQRIKRRVYADVVAALDYIPEMEYAGRVKGSAYAAPKL